MFKTLLITLAVIALIVIAWAVNLLWSAGQFKTIAPHFSGKCITVSGLIGAVFDPKFLDCKMKLSP